MDGIDTKTCPAPLFPVNGESVVGRFNLAVAKPTRDEGLIGIFYLLRRTRIGKLPPVLEVSESWQFERWMADKQDPPVGSNAVNRADNDIGGQQYDQQLKPQ